MFQLLRKCHVTCGLKQLKPTFLCLELRSPYLLQKERSGSHKVDQRIEYGIGAAVALLNGDVCLVLEQAKLDPYLDALRAPVTLLFESRNILPLLWRETQILKARHTYSESHCHCPVIPDLEAIRASVQVWNSARCHSTLLSSLLETVVATSKSKWPVGYVILVATERNCRVYNIAWKPCAQTASPC